MITRNSIGVVKHASFKNIEEKKSNRLVNKVENKKSFCANKSSTVMAMIHKSLKKNNNNKNRIRLYFLYCKKPVYRMTKQKQSRPHPPPPDCRVYTGPAGRGEGSTVSQQRASAAATQLRRLCYKPP